MILLEEAAPATLAGVSQLRRSLRLCLSELRLPSRTRDDLQLAIAELGSNIVRHGAPAATTLGLRLSLERDLLRADLEDDGGPFEGFEQALRAAPAPDGGMESGMGLDFVRQATDSLHYRPGPPNRTVMMRRLHDARARLLVVEDDTVLRALYGGILGKAFAVEAVGSLGAARESLARQAPDLIIADLHLEDGKGHEMAASLAPSKDRPLAPLIILTADLRPAVKTALAREGVDAILHKPVTPAELMAAARGALARSARQQASALARLGALLNQDGAPATASLAAGWRMARAGQAAGLGSGDIVVLLEKPGRTRLVMADVMGHGLQAATAGLALTGALRVVNALAGDDPAAFLQALGAAMASDDALGEIFATVLVVDLLPDGGVEVATAGHPLPLVLAHDGRLDRLAGGGPLLGLLRAPAYATTRRTLVPGERLLVMTDGLEPAALAADGPPPPWLADAVRQARRDPIEAMAAAVANAMQAQPAPELADDWTILLLEPAAWKPAAR